MLRAFTIAALFLVSPLAVLGAVRGRVVSVNGTPIEHARVELAGVDSVIYSAADGTFSFPESSPPGEVEVHHPRFEPFQRSFGEADLPITIELEAKLEIYEEVAVSANRGEENFSPVSVASTVIDPVAAVGAPATLTELVAETPGVAQNGQGGIFQTYSIRGVSRQRVLTLISGMRVVSERRAGVSASFLDPLLLGAVDVVRGPSSSFWGSGALGGVVQLFPRRFEGAAASVGYKSEGDENFQMIGWGEGDWSLGFARRSATSGETPAGGTLFSGFRQFSATVERRWSRGGLDFEVLLIGSLGEDIEKASTDFPDRLTVYPEEQHALVRFGLRSSSDWRLEVWAHPNSLKTRVDEGSGRDEVDNEATDLGINWQRSLETGRRSSARVGVDYFGRRGVDAVEIGRDLTRPGAPEMSRQQTLDGGEEDEAGLYGAFEWNPGSVTILSGARFAWQRQSNSSAPATDDTALTAFAGAVAPLGAGFEVVGNVGTGLRFPSLSERFFSGTTGRGEVIGNPTLESEGSLNFDVGLRWYGDKLYFSSYLFRNDIDDYIERIEISPGMLTFRNLVSGAIEGVELDGFFQASRQWSFTFGGHKMEGRGDGGEPLADIAADRVFLTGKWRNARWGVQSRWEHRWSKNDPGSGEKPVPHADLLSTNVSFEVNDQLSLSLSARNLFDEEYFNSADRRVPLSPGRALGISASWTE